MSEEDILVREEDFLVSDEADTLSVEDNPRCVPGARAREQDISLFLADDARFEEAESGSG
jgi:hypothetical protein